VIDQGVHDPSTQGEASPSPAADAAMAGAQGADLVVTNPAPADAPLSGPSEAAGEAAAPEQSGDAIPADVVEAGSEVPAPEEATPAPPPTQVGKRTAGAALAETVETVSEEEVRKDWYILKVQVNREDSIRDALLRRIKIQGLQEYFGEIVVPTEDVAEFNKSGKRKIVKRKLYPGYLLANLALNDETWFLVRETPGVGDFTGSAGRPTAMDARDVERILRLGAAKEEEGGQVKTAIPFETGDRVRVKDGYFQNFEGEVAAIDHANGRITVMINIFGRSTPVELEHWQVESV
jgi:transcriptional antiterminator NusG